MRIAIGSDGISGERTFATARDEVQFIAAHGLADNLALLRMWCDGDAAHHLPAAQDRRAGAGYEASFLVLGGDPLADVANLERIAMRVKQGLVLPPMAGPVILKRG